MRFGDPERERNDLIWLGHRLLVSALSVCWDPRSVTPPKSQGRGKEVAGGPADKRVDSLYMYGFGQGV